MNKPTDATNLMLIALSIAAPAVILVLFPWLTRQPDFVLYLAAGLAVLWSLTCSMVVSVRADKSADEWQRGGTRFSYFWGGIAGTALVTLLLAVPAFHLLLVRIAAWGQGVSVGEVDRPVVVLSFTAGFITIVLSQTLCALMFFLLWQRRTLGRAE